MKECSVCNFVKSVTIIVVFLKKRKEEKEDQLSRLFPWAPPSPSACISVVLRRLL